MLHPGDPAGLDRETALAVLAELERLERSERHLLRLQEQLHAIVDELTKASAEKELEVKPSRGQGPGERPGLSPAAPLAPLPGCCAAFPC